MACSCSIKRGNWSVKRCETCYIKRSRSVAYCSLNGDVDAAVVFQDARNIVKRLSEYIRANENSEIYGENSNDTISVRSDLDEEWSKKLQDAFIEIENEEGHKIIKEVYSHEGYVKSDDSKFDIVREYGKKVKRNNTYGNGS